MAQTTHQKTLTALGLTEKEAAVYLALLEEGKGTVSAIAKKAGTNRTTVYDIVGSLIAKKLVTPLGKEPVQEYAPESPESVVTMLKERLKQTTEQLDRAQRLLPDFLSLYHKGSRPRVRFYEDFDGLRQAYENTLTATETIRAYANIDDMHEALPHYFPGYYVRRAQKGIRIRAIFPQTKQALARIEKNEEEGRTAVLVPKDKFYFSPEINIYDNKVMIASWRERLAIVIESAEIADAMKKIFELSWAQAERLHANIIQKQSVNSGNALDRAKTRLKS